MFLGIMKIVSILILNLFFLHFVKNERNPIIDQIINKKWILIEYSEFKNDSILFNHKLTDEELNCKFRNEMVFFNKGKMTMKFNNRFKFKGKYKLEDKIRIIPYISLLALDMDTLCPVTSEIRVKVRDMFSDIKDITLTDRGVLVLKDSKYQLLYQVQN